MSNLTSKSRRALDRALDNYKRITELSRAHGHRGSQHLTQYPGSSGYPVSSRKSGYEDDDSRIYGHENRLPLCDNRPTQRDYRIMPGFDAVPRDRDQTRELFYSYMDNEETASPPGEEPRSKSRVTDLPHTRGGNRGSLWDLHGSGINRVPWEV